jgi:aconitase A
LLLRRLKSYNLSKDPYQVKKLLTGKNGVFTYYSLTELEKQGRAPAVVEITSLHAEIARKGKNPDEINPLIPLDLMIGHSVQVGYFENEYSYATIAMDEMEKN